MQRASLFLILAIVVDDELLLRDVDTIEELTDILVSDEHRLVDLSGGGGHSLNIVTLEDDLILLSVGLDDSHSLEHVDHTHSLLSQEVTDLDLLSLLVDGHVDGEVSVHESHLVAVSAGNSGDHVADVGADGADHSDVLVESEPEVDNNLGALLLDVHELVGEVTAEDTAGSLNDHTSVLDVNLDYAIISANKPNTSFGDIDMVRGKGDLHLVTNSGRTDVYFEQRVAGTESLIIYKISISHCTLRTTVHAHTYSGSCRLVCLDLQARLSPFPPLTLFLVLKAGQ